jgi:hypothetical protein
MRRRSRTLIIYVPFLVPLACSSSFGAQPVTRSVSVEAGRKSGLVPTRRVSRQAPGKLRLFGEARRSPAPQDTAQSRSTIVVDVDDTLCTTDYKCVIFGIGADHSRPFADAAQTLRDLSRNYEILYLTARPATVSHRTQRWLDANDFPPGRIIGSKTLWDVIDQASYKKRVLARLQQEGQGVFVGIGDRPRDAKAYHATGLLPIVVNPRPECKYQPDALIFEDWESVAAYFKESGIESRMAVMAERAKTGSYVNRLPTAAE